MIYFFHICAFTAFDFPSIRPQIVELNPNWRLFQFLNPNLDYNIRLAYRAGGSSTTFKIQQYLKDACVIRCPGAFTANASFTTENFPHDALSYAVGADNDIAAFMKVNPMVLGYVALLPARNNKLQEIWIDDYSGMYRSPLTSTPYSAINITDFPLDSTYDYDGLNFVYRPNSYPIVLASYLWIHKDMSTLGDSSSLLKAFITLVLSEEGQSMVSEFGMFRLPPDVLAFSRRSLQELITDPSVQPFTFEGTTAQVGKGASSRTMSSLRASIVQYELSLMYTTLSRQAVANGASLGGIQARVMALEATAYPDNEARYMSAAAVAFGALAVASPNPAR